MGGKPFAIHDTSFRALSFHPIASVYLLRKLEKAMRTLEGQGEAGTDGQMEADSPHHERQHVDSVEQSSYFARSFSGPNGIGIEEMQNAP